MLIIEIKNKKMSNSVFFEHVTVCSLVDVLFSYLLPRKRAANLSVYLFVAPSNRDRLKKEFMLEEQCN